MNLFENIWFIQLIGTGGLLFIVFSFQGRTRTQILARQIVASSFFIVHFFLLGAYVGAAMNGLIIIRNWVFEQKHKKAWSNSWRWSLFFSALAVGLLYFVWQGTVSTLPVAGIIIGTYSRWSEKVSSIRFHSVLFVSRIHSMAYI